METERALRVLEVVRDTPEASPTAMGIIHILILPSPSQTLSKKGGFSTREGSREVLGLRHHKLQRCYSMLLTCNSSVLSYSLQSVFTFSILLRLSEQLDK